MALTKELLQVLDNENEPLKKRLRIADNAFKATSLPIHHREFILLRWIGKLTESGDVEVWNQCYAWLASRQFQELNQTEIDLNNFNYIIDLIIERLDNSTEDVKAVISKISSILIQNNAFQQYFKYEIQKYCEFLSAVITNIKDEESLIAFLNLKLFSKFLVHTKDFHNHFFKTVFQTLCYIGAKYPDNPNIYKAIIKIKKLSVFSGNFETFQSFFTGIFKNEYEEHPLPILLFNNFKPIYKLEESKAIFGFKIMYHAFCECYRNDPVMIYQFLILILNKLGFNLATTYGIKRLKIIDTIEYDLEVSSKILTEFLEVLSKININLELVLCEISFKEFLTNFINSLIKIKRPNETFYKQLMLAIEINPLIAVDIFDTVIDKMMLSKNSNAKLYERAMISIFQVFVKLHRVNNLVNKMLEALKKAVEVEKGLAEDNEYNVENILPGGLLEYFTQSIVNEPSWKLITMFETLLKYLNSSVECDIQTIANNKNQIIYIEIISTLLCQFLISVRTAEYTVSTNVVEAFETAMAKEKDLLAKFGGALVKLEHNRTLMRSFLNLCYTWAELSIILKYYSLNEEVQKLGDADSSACNLTYLHSYLTKEQWCLIYERITNFGEKPCTLIMQKLCIQKLRAMLIFESNVNEEAYSSLTNILSISLPDNYEFLINNRFSLNTIINKMDQTSISVIADHILQDIVNFKNYQPLKTISECSILSSTVLYSCLTKIRKLFKNKRKSGEGSQFVTPLVFKEITEEEFLSGDGLEEKIPAILNILCRELNKKETQVNEGNLKIYVEIIKNLPVFYFDVAVQNILFLFLTAVVIDLKTVGASEEAWKGVEEVIIGLFETEKISIFRKTETNSLVDVIIKNFEKYDRLFECSLKKALVNEDELKIVLKYVTYLTEDWSKYEHRKCCALTLNVIKQHEKYTKLVTREIKKVIKGFRKVIARALLKNIKGNVNYEYMELYSLVFKNLLSFQNTEMFKELEQYLEEFIKLAMEEDSKPDGNSEAWIILLLSLIERKSKCDEIINDDFIMKVWRLCKSRYVHEKHSGAFSKLISNIFKICSNENFTNITNDLLQNTIVALDQGNFEKFISLLRYWSLLLWVDFKTEKVTKSKICQTAIQNFLFKFSNSTTILKNDTLLDELLSFQINIIQSTNVPLSSIMYDAILNTLNKSLVNPTDFQKAFTASHLILKYLIGQHKNFTATRLPSYLQQYRGLLKLLCANSDSNVEAGIEAIQIASNCAHQFEQLTRDLLKMSDKLACMAQYVIADIIYQYEIITLYPAVKLHLNNCIYSLISLLNDPEIESLCRVMSEASTQIFKLQLESYNKYYKYTGKA